MQTNTKKIVYIALMAAILCILAPISIPIPVSTISLTLATLAIYIIAYVLEPKEALAAVGLYLLLGAIGLPVFSGYMSGISRFVAPGGGYLVGYLFLAGISS
ncbi:MAG: biotin transporter BioY, partial [Anaerotignum sp.]